MDCYPITTIGVYIIADNLIAPPAQDVPQATPSAPPAPPKLCVCMHSSLVLASSLPV